MGVGCRPGKANAGLGDLSSPQPEGGTCAELPMDTSILFSTTPMASPSLGVGKDNKMDRWRASKTASNRQQQTWPGQTPLTTAQKRSGLTSTHLERHNRYGTLCALESQEQQEKRETR